MRAAIVARAHVRCVGAKDERGDEGGGTDGDDQQHCAAIEGTVGGLRSDCDLAHARQAPVTAKSE